MAALRLGDQGHLKMRLLLKLGVVLAGGATVFLKPWQMVRVCHCLVQVLFIVMIL